MVLGGAQVVDRDDLDVGARAPVRAEEVAADAAEAVDADDVLPSAFAPRFSLTLPAAESSQAPSAN